MSKYVLPQPAPKPGCAAVWPLVIEDAKRAGVSQETLDDMLARHEFGCAKYPRPLETGNGRDALADAYQEALDGAAYLFQWTDEAQIDDERAHRRRLYKVALWWADRLRAELKKRDGE